MRCCLNVLVVTILSASQNYYSSILKSELLVYLIVCEKKCSHSHVVHLLIILLYNMTSGYDVSYIYIYFIIPTPTMRKGKKVLPMEPASYLINLIIN